MQGSPARIAVDRRVIICVRIVSIRTDSGDRRHHKRLNFQKNKLEGKLQQETATAGKGVVSWPTNTVARWCGSALSEQRSGQRVRGAPAVF